MERVLLALLPLALVFSLAGSLGGRLPFPIPLIFFYGVALTLAWWKRGGRETMVRSFKRDVVFRAMVVLVIVLAVAASINLAPPSYAMTWLGVALLYTYARWRLPDVVSARRVTVSLVVVLVGLTTLAVVQFVTTSRVGSPYQVGQGSVSLSRDHTEGGPVQRAPAVFQESNGLGQWLIYATILAGALASLRPRPGVPLLCMGLAALGIALTLSRGTVVVFAMILGLYLLFLAARSKLGLSIALMATASVGVALLVLSPDIEGPERFSQAELAASFEERSVLNEQGVDLAEENPWTGVGYLRVTEESPTATFRPHNVYIQVAAEHGVIAAAVLVWLLLSMMWLGWRAFWPPRGRRLGGRVAPLLVALSTAGLALTYPSALDFAMLPMAVVVFGYTLATLDKGRSGNRYHPSQVSYLGRDELARQGPSLVPTTLRTTASVAGRSTAPTV